MCTFLYIYKYILYVCVFNDKRIEYPFVNYLLFINNIQTITSSDTKVAPVAMAMS
jgi:hypothetical protein